MKINDISYKSIVYERRKHALPTKGSDLESRNDKDVLNAFTFK